MINASSMDALICEVSVKISGSNSKIDKPISIPAVKAARNPMRLLFFIAKTPPIIVAKKVIITVVRTEIMLMSKSNHSRELLPFF